MLTVRRTSVRQHSEQRIILQNLDRIRMFRPQESVRNNKQPSAQGGHHFQRFDEKDATTPQQLIYIVAAYKYE